MNEEQRTDQKFSYQSSEIELYDIQFIPERDQVLRSFLDCSMDGFILVEEQGLIIEWNYGMENIFGLSSSEAKGKYIWDLMARFFLLKQVDYYREVLKSFLSTGQASWLNKLLVTDIKLINNEEKCIQKKTFSIKTEKGYMLGATVRDITQQRYTFLPMEQLVKEQTKELIKTNFELKEQISQRKFAENQLRKITDNMQDMIAQTDEAGAIQYVSPSYQSVLGYKTEEMIGKTFIEFLRHEDKQRLFSAFDIKFRNGNWGFIEFLHRHADGHYIWVEITGKNLYGNNGKAIGTVFCLRNISKRKKAELALRESEERYRLLVEMLPDAIIVHRNERIVFINKSGAKLFGTEDPSGFIGRSIWDLVHPDYYQIVREQLNKIHENKEFLQFMEKKLVKLDGTTFEVEINGAPFTYEEKPSVIVILRDITERKRTEQKMARLDQLNLVAEMAAGIGHEVRNPMTTVRGFLQMLGGKEDCIKYKDYYNLMIEELDRANSIITEYLSLAKTKSCQKKKRQINSIIESILPLIKSETIKNEVNLITDLEEVQDLLLDEKEIRQLILNLVRNGIEAMDGGGIITIKTYQEGEDVILSVQDQGTGIKDHILKKLGTPFFTTKDNGTGLGLAVSYSIADRHNAIIKVKTDLSGTTFFVKFKTT